jgi:hypothetical protein
MALALMHSDSTAETVKEHQCHHYISTYRGVRCKAPRHGIRWHTRRGYSKCYGRRSTKGMGQEVMMPNFV